MNEPAFLLRGITRVYGSRCVLDVPELAIPRGEVFAVVGPSGAGKSTLLRLLNFLEPPTTGTVRFCGHEVGAEVGAPLELRRQVTTVFQRPVLLNRSVRANVTFGLRLRGQRDAAESVGQALEQVGLREYAGQAARTLSGGEAQRVALARALILRPQVLLLDEPTANLDPYNVGLIEEIVRGVNQTQGTTVVLVTHNVFQARRLAHRVALLLEGRMVEVADTLAFFERPQDARTAAFVRGDMVY